MLALDSRARKDNDAHIGAEHPGAEAIQGFEFMQITAIENEKEKKTRVLQRSPSAVSIEKGTYAPKDMKRATSEDK